MLFVSKNTINLPNFLKIKFRSLDHGNAFDIQDREINLFCIAFLFLIFILHGINCSNTFAWRTEKKVLTSIFFRKRWRIFGLWIWRASWMNLKGARSSYPEPFFSCKVGSGTKFSKLSINLQQSK